VRRSVSLWVPFCAQRLTVALCSRRPGKPLVLIFIPDGKTKSMSVLAGKVARK
jgi:hypothetical protein